MKSSKFNFLTGLMLSVACLGFTACGDDDEPKVEDNYTTEYTFTAEFSADLLKTADIKAYILSPEGTVSEETITNADNTWTVRGNSIPDKAGIRFDFDLKSGNFSGNYKLGYKVKTSTTCLNNGKVASYTSDTSEAAYTVPAEKLTGFYGTSLTLGGCINDKGEASVTDGADLDFGLNSSIIKPPFGGNWF